MTCANWLITILSAIVLVFTIWPTLLGDLVAKYIIIITTIIIILIVWTGCSCKYCKNMPKKK